MRVRAIGPGLSEAARILHCFSIVPFLSMYREPTDCAKSTQIETPGILALEMIMSSRVRSESTQVMYGSVSSPSCRIGRAGDLWGTEGEAAGQGRGGQVRGGQES